MITREQVEQHIPRGGGHYDVIVAGAGPAGLGAALAARKAGARTLLLEARGVLGGVAAVAHFMPMNRLKLQGGQRGGVHDDFVRKVEGLGPEASRPGRVNAIDGDGLDVHPDYLQLACYELLEEAGVDYRVYAPVSDAIMARQQVTGVVVAAKGQREAFTGEVVVDATGDGDVAYAAGAAYLEGREDDGQHMPVSLVFDLANCDVERVLAFHAVKGALQEVVARAAAAGYATAAWYSFDQTTVPGVLTVNNGAFAQIGNIDATNLHDLTVAQRLGLQVATDFVRLARAYAIPGLEQCHLARIGGALGVRDTRRFVGEYVLTLEDAVQGVAFPDVVARKYGQTVDANQLYMGPMTDGYAYPYRSMVPVAVDGLLLAGRCGSATFYGHAAGKSMGNMMALGQAAGAAAALCTQAGVQPRALDVAALQALLRGWGVRL
jgi:hypothetical protein